jgi:MFS family permease
MAQARRGNVDWMMGGVLVAGGLLGSVVGVQLFALLRRLGQVDAAVALFYVVVLGVVGCLMMMESLRAIRRRRAAQPRRLHQHSWAHGLPFKLRFRKSRLYISVIPPLAVGFGIGVLSAVMGVGGGFMLVPAMIYVLGMPTAVVIGTSLFQVVCVTASVTFLQACEVGYPSGDAGLGRRLLDHGRGGAARPAGGAAVLRAGGHHHRLHRRKPDGLWQHGRPHRPGRRRGIGGGARPLRALRGAPQGAGAGAVAERAGRALR